MFLYLDDVIMTSSYDVIEWKNLVYIYHIQDILCRDQICKDPHLCNNIKFSLATGKNKYEHPQTGSSDLNILSIDYCTWTISLFQIIETVKYYAETLYWYHRYCVHGKYICLESAVGILSRALNCFQMNYWSESSDWRLYTCRHFYWVAFFWSLLLC